MLTLQRSAPPIFHISGVHWSIGVLNLQKVKGSNHSRTTSSDWDNRTQLLLQPPYPGNFPSPFSVIVCITTWVFLKEKNHSNSDYLTNLVFKPRVIIFIDIILHTGMGMDIGLDYFYVYLRWCFLSDVCNDPAYRLISF